MPLVNIMVNSRAYTIACDEGEEAHLKDLAGLVDAKVREVLSSVGQVADSRLLLMAALLLADEHHAAMVRLDASAKAAGDLEGVRSALEARVAATERHAAEILEDAARQVEETAVRLAAV